jgi:hypothetical protein
MQSNGIPKYFELGNDNFNIVDKLKYFIKLTTKIEHNINDNNTSNFDNINTYNTTPTGSINKYVKLHKKFFNIDVNSISSNIFTNNGLLIDATNSKEKQYDYYSFLKDYNRDIQFFNIFILFNNKYYQINNKYITQNYINNLGNLDQYVSRNNYKDFYKIYNEYYIIMYDILYKIKYNKSHNNNTDKNINYLVTMLFNILCQAYLNDFITKYYMLLNIYSEKHNIYYTNIIINIDDNVIYRLDNIKYMILNYTPANKTIPFLSIDENNDQCYENNMCNYHIIKWSYNPVNNDYNVLIYKLNDHDFNLLINKLSRLNSNNIDSIPDNLLPISNFNSNLMLYTTYSANVYKYNNHLNLFKNNIFFINI